MAYIFILTVAKHTVMNTSEKLQTSLAQCALHGGLHDFNEVVWKGIRVDEVSKGPAAK